MSTDKNRISEDAAIDLLGRLYQGRTDEEMSLAEIYAAAGRDSIDEKTNRNWFNGVLAKLGDYKLVVPVRRFENSRKRVVGMKMTTVGKTALGWANEDAPERGRQGGVQGITLEEMLSAVEVLRKKYPGFDIELTIKPKETSM